MCVLYSRSMPTCDDSDFEDKSVTIAGDKEVLEEQFVVVIYEVTR